MNKPIAIGVSVLEWSKTHMYDFYYDVMKEKYGDQIHMHYTDTDSLFLRIETEDLYRDIAGDLEMATHLDLSNYKDTHPLFTQFGNKDELMKIKSENKAVFGKFKDENAGGIINEMCFIKAKMYSFTKEGDTKATFKAKGVKKSAMKELTHDRYRKCLLSAERQDRVMDTTFYRISCKNHELATIKQTKRALSHYDDKRHYMNALQSLAHGHYKICTK